MQSKDNNTFNINKTIDSYNADAMSAYMQSVLGEEMWQRYKPTKNVLDIISGKSNDNQNVQWFVNPVGAKKTTKINNRQLVRTSIFDNLNAMKEC